MSTPKSNPQSASKESSKDKVGSNPDAAHKVSGKGDFGNPVAPPAVVRLNDDDPIESRPAGSALGTGADPGRRTVGVGSKGGGDGDSSAGDIDLDFVGVAGAGGLSQSAGGTVSNGADQAEDTSRQKKTQDGKQAGPGPIRGTTTSAPDARTGRESASENQVDPQDTR